MNANVTSQSKCEKKNCTGRYSRGLRNQNGKYAVDLWESNILET